MISSARVSGRPNAARTPSTMERNMLVVREPCGAVVPRSRIRTTIMKPKVRASKPAAALRPAQLTSTPPTAVPVTAKTTPVTW